jgi:hypothetical protein
MLDRILIDNDPQRLAELEATLDEGIMMIEKGISGDEAFSIFKKTPKPNKQQAVEFNQKNLQV